MTLLQGFISSMRKSRVAAQSVIGSSLYTRALARKSCSAQAMRFDRGGDSRHEAMTRWRALDLRFEIKRSRTRSATDEDTRQRSAKLRTLFTRRAARYRMHTARAWPHTAAPWRRARYFVRTARSARVIRSALPHFRTTTPESALFNFGCELYEIAQDKPNRAATALRPRCSRAA